MATTTHPAIPTPTASSADHPLSAPLAPPGHRMEGPPPGGGSGLPPAPPHPAEPVHTPPRTRRTRLWIGIAAAVLLLLAAVAAVLVFYRPSFEVTAIEAPADVVAGEDVILVNAISGGSNRLRIVNNGERDLLLVLAPSGENAEALLSVYVRADSETTVTGLRNGTYVTYYMRGNAWCSHLEEFTQDQSAGRFEEEAVFAATKPSYTIYTVEMSVSGQGSPTEMVDPDDMPS